MTFGTISITFVQAFLHWVGCVGIFLFFAVGALIFALVIDTFIMIVKDIYRRIRK